jgi:hypothetical protein
MTPAVVAAVVVGSSAHRHTPAHRRAAGKDPVGYSTHYLGRLDIEPVLNQAEIEWLRAYAEVWEPGEWGYDLPPNPRGAIPDSRRRGRELTGADEDPEVRTPWGRCDWRPCVQGCCLGWREFEKSNNAVAWLEHLVEHFLCPDGLARGMHRDFADFTFDHVVRGVIAAERGDSRQLFLIRAVDNVITTETLVAGDPWDW